MEAAASGGVTFAADQEGGFIFPDFLPSFDGAAALVKLIALLGRSRASRWPSWSSGSPKCTILHTEVETPFEQKGMVMRTLMEQLARRRTPIGPPRRDQGGHRRRVGCWWCPTPRSRPPTVGRGRRPGRFGAPQRRVRRAVAPDPRRHSGQLDGPTVSRDRASASVAPHEHSRRPSLLGRTRMGADRRQSGRAWASPTTPRTRSATSSSSTSRRSGRRWPPVDRWARWSRPSRSRRSTRRWPERSPRSTMRFPMRPSGSTRIPTARAGSASWNWPRPPALEALLDAAAYGDLTAA